MVAFRHGNGTIGSRFQQERATLTLSWSESSMNEQISSHIEIERENTEETEQIEKISLWLTDYNQISLPWHKLEVHLIQPSRTTPP